MHWLERIERMNVIDDMEREDSTEENKTPKANVNEGNCYWKPDGDGHEMAEETGE